jgi:hypothetical protein
MNKQKKIVRIICLILAFLMVAGAATIIISLLASVGGHAGHMH